MSTLYTSLLSNMATGVVVLNSGTYKAMLVQSGYTPSKNHTTRADITNEASGTGYTAGGVAVTLTVSTNTGLNRMEVTSTNPSWTTASITAVGMVIYKSLGGASSADALVCFSDFGGSFTSTGGTFAVTAASPLITITN